MSPERPSGVYRRHAYLGPYAIPEGPIDRRPTLGPAEVLGEEVRGLAGIEAAAIFGSWAARAAGEAGPSPVDIDLLVIGRPDRDDLQDAAGRAQARLGREVSTVVVSAERWNSRNDAFLAELRGRPMAALAGVPEPQDMEEQR
jgi:predicted nucleotidyltransferase